jgi:uncharacterized protein
MSNTVIEAVRNKVFLRLAPDSRPTIVWHAGEPTVAPISWYEHAYELLTPVAPAGATFSIQSNGVSISDEWIDFLTRTDTQIGLSIDGPQRYHDARRKTRAGRPTWALVVRSLRRLQSAGISPNVISVLHPQALSAAKEYYQFYRDNDINQVSFSIDEAEGANTASSFDGFDYKPRMVGFLNELLNLAFADGYPLYIREIERIARGLAAGEVSENEQVEPWKVIVVAANGDVTTFSPEFMETKSALHNNFCFGNILEHQFEEIADNIFLKRTSDEIRQGTETCRIGCRYFAICGGGAPVNRMFENGTLISGETSFCRLSIQAPADALLAFLGNKERLPTLPA